MAYRYVEFDFYVMVMPLLRMSHKVFLSPTLNEWYLLLDLSHISTVKKEKEEEEDILKDDPILLTQISCVSSTIKIAPIHTV